MLVRAGTSRRWLLIAYPAMLGLALAVYSVIGAAGDQLTAPAPSPAQPLFAAGRNVAHGDTLAHLLLALAVVIVVARALGALFARIAQPPVVGEIVAGILLGPSLLGQLAPDVQAFVFPAEVVPLLGMLSQVGVILFMFVVGVELDPSVLGRRGHVTLAISHASIVLPFLLGAGLAIYVYPTLSTSDVPFTVFALFLGASMSVTAFPVLARILTDRRMGASPIGMVALTCAAIDDVTAWCLLAFVVAVAHAHTTDVLITFACVAGYMVVMVAVARPAMAWLSRLHERRGLTQGVLALVFLALLASALATDAIGIHAVFGAFALGATVPHGSRLAHEIRHRLGDLVVVLLLPAFFAFTGLRTQIGLIASGDQWLLCAIIIAVASLGKFGGTFAAARLTGLDWRSSTALGVLMNTRGLMELIVLNIGLELRVLSPALFAMLVLMALATTFMTTPLLQLVARGLPADDARTADLAGTPPGLGAAAPPG